mmetsp:Transcript_106607/g.308468  ORF Transcript_106607/g.308468 Transcript_106607/m.308468 type:complete len:320 (+) Transcript_106607:3-962(+)
MQSTGLFWQCADDLFEGFPAMNLNLPRELRLGRRVGPCLLESELGHGSFGKVYGALQVRPDKREEALKVIAKASVTKTRHASALHREIRLHGQLQHQHVVRLHGAMHGPLHIFLRMERASGPTLFRAMRSACGCLPIDRAQRYQRQLADAIAYCHSQSVAHRDLKPENIALDSDGSDIKVLDFGCCVPTGLRRADVVGTFPFMAPETFVASKSMRYEPSAVDVWACAVILLEMLCGVNQLSRMLGWSDSTSATPARYGELASYFEDRSAVRQVLAEKLGGVDNDLEELLRGSLAVSCEHRWTAALMAESPWLVSGLLLE